MELNICSFITLKNYVPENIDIDIKTKEGYLLKLYKFGLLVIISSFILVKRV